MWLSATIQNRSAENKEGAGKIEYGNNLRKIEKSRKKSLTNCSEMSILIKCNV